MKNYMLFFLLFLLFSCKNKNTQESSQIVENSPVAKEDITEKATDDLKQNGNYTSLFGNTDCNVVSTEELNNTLGKEFIDLNIKGQCAFKTKIADKKEWYLSFVKDKMSKKDVQREIQNYKSDETGQLDLLVSETGDTYLCNQHRNGYLSLLNPNYDGALLIRYGSIGESRAFSKEERLQQRNDAVTLANFILMKNKK